MCHRWDDFVFDVLREISMMWSNTHESENQGTIGQGFLALNYVFGVLHFKGVTAARWLDS